MGTAPNSVLGKALLEELVIDTAMPHSKARGGLQPQEITTDLILEAQDVVETNLMELEVPWAESGWTGNRTKHCHGSKT